MMSIDEGPKLNVEDLLFFPGKELNETNIAGRRSPPQPIRLAIGRHGVYKFEREQNKVLAFWGFQELSDWSFSGYSFTLNFTNKKDYHLRTDDGQAISHWIDSFSKNPDQAAIAAQQFKSLGGTNTMRKFTAELRPINYQNKYYTLNPRRNKHITDQSRMLNAYGVDRNKTLTLPTPQSSYSQSSKLSESKRWSTGTSLKNGSNEDFRSASLEATENDKKGVAQHRAHSMDSLLNGSVGGASHSNGTAPILPPPLVGAKITPPRIISSSNDRGFPLEHEINEEEVPIIPPRKTSLNQVSEHEYSVIESGGSNIMIKVEEEENCSLTPPKPRPHKYEEVEIMKPDSLSVSCSSSGEYDHLYPSKKGFKNALRRKKDKELTEEEGGEGVVHSPIRRNESLPPMIFHSPLLKKKSAGEEEEEEEEEESDTEDEITSPIPPVVYRNKKDDCQELDYFADLLSAPPSRSHLRWSQNLNPIYDNIRAMKISPSIAYEATSIMAKPDQVIQEENSECSDKTKNSPEIIRKEMIFVGGGKGKARLSPPKRRPHNYEEVQIGCMAGGRDNEPTQDENDRPRLNSNRPMSDHYQTLSKTRDKSPQDFEDKSATLSSPVRRLKSADTAQFISPRLNKRVIQRRSKTVKSSDDFNAPQGRQHAQKVADTMKDFSYTNREYRVFYIKLPNGQLVSEVVNINRPVSILIDKLIDQLRATGSSDASVYVEGAILTTMKEAVLEFGELQPAKAQVDRSVSLTQLVDSNSLADQGSAPLLLKNSLSFRMQGITTSRILRLDDGEDSAAAYDYIPLKNEFHKKWLGVVQGNQPCTQEAAVKLAAIQYQAYFLDRTAENSVVGFCRPNEFLPAEFAGMRGIEHRMYKEQEKIKSRNQIEIQKFYIKYCCSLPTNDTIFFPVREPRRKLFQSTKLKPVLLGINKNGIMRLCPKTKEVLDCWEYQVLKNWAYSRKTFVIAFNNKTYPVESNQARWISELVDFFVDSIIHSSPPPPSTQSKN